MLNINNLTLQVNIGALEDVIDASTPFELQITEQIGNNLPSAQIKISLPPHFENELTEVYLKFGFSADEAIYSRWQITGFVESANITTLLLTTDRSYVNDTKYKTYNDTSVNTIKKVVKEYYEIEDRNGDTFQIKNTNDRMLWCHNGTPIRDFVDTLWLHSWFDENTLMIPAITAGTSKPSMKAGTFRLIDLNKWDNVIELSRDRDTDKNLTVITSDINYCSHSGKYNNRIGNRTDTNFNITTSVPTHKTIDPKKENKSPIFKGKYNERNINNINEPPIILSDNVHTNFSKAKAFNLTRLSKFSGYSKRIQVADYDTTGKEFKNIVIGDIVQLNTWQPGTNVQSNVHSGYYVVAETIQRITTDGATKNYTKELILRRDGNGEKEKK